MAHKDTQLTTLEEQVKTLESQVTSLNAWKTSMEQAHDETKKKMDANHHEVMTLLQTLISNQTHTLLEISNTPQEQELDCEAKMCEGSHVEDLRMLGKCTNSINNEHKLLLHTNGRSEWIYDDVHLEKNLNFDVFDWKRETNQLNMELVGLFELLKYDEIWVIVIGTSIRVLKDEHMFQAHQVFENCFEPNKSTIMLNLETKRDEMLHCTEVNIEFNEWKGGTKMQVKEFAVDMSLWMGNKEWCLMRDYREEFVMGLDNMIIQGFVSKMYSYSFTAAEVRFHHHEDNTAYDWGNDTVFALWIVPELLSSFIRKGGEVSRYVIGGADLMFLGISVASEGLPPFQAGTTWAMKAHGNPAPIAIGSTVVSSAEAIKAGMRGKALRITHYYWDLLWESVEGRYVPNAGFLEDVVFEDPESTSLGQASNSFDNNNDYSNDQLNGPNNERHEEYTVVNDIIGSDSPSTTQLDSKAGVVDEVIAAVDDLKLKDTVSVNESTVEEQHALSMKDVDAYLDKCLLKALHTSVKDKDLPMPRSTFWSNHVLPCRPSGVTLDIKKSSHKKLSRWLQAKSSICLIAVNVVDLVFFNKSLIMLTVDHAHTSTHIHIHIHISTLISNGWNSNKCKRQWNFVDSDHLRYKFMNAFDRALHALDEKFSFLSLTKQIVSNTNAEDTVIVFERGDLVFVFKFHPDNTYDGYKVGCDLPGKYRVALNSDAWDFGGRGRVGHDVDHFTNPGGLHMQVEDSGVKIILFILYTKMVKI